MFCATRKCGKSAYSWKTIPTRRDSVGTMVPGAETSVPSMEISPDCTGSNPAMARSVVVFPQPEGPRMQRISPSRAWIEISAIAGWPLR